MRRSGLFSAVLAISLMLCGGALSREALKPWEILRPTSPLPPAIETGRQDVGDVDLYYAVYGQGDPVILLHPALGNADDWASQIGPLSQEFQVIVIDLRGHGRSSGSDAPLSYRLMAEDVLHFIKGRKIKQPAIIGWGDGATVGLELARRYPKRIGRFIAFGLAFNRTGLQQRPDEEETFIQYVLQAQAEYARLSGNGAGFVRTLDQWEALWERAPDYTPDDLAALKVPTTIIAAEHDEWVRYEHMTEAARLIPGVTFVGISRASHFAPWQATKPFNDVLRLALGS